MPHLGLQAIAGYVRRHTAPRSTDGELLERFVSRRDESAFTELVARHGPKVFAVCRRVLGHHHLAEDAFQATFAVLARKAGAIHPRSAVGGFLYGVARKAALEAFAMHRRRKETLVGRVPDAPQPAARVPETDALAVLDEEIANLSEAYRAAVVLCELDGVSRADAARQLGIARGTLSSRLATARKRLAERLKKRGVALSAGLLAALAESATAAVPPALCTGTVNAVAITQGVLRAMLITKLKVTAALGVLLTASVAWALTPSATTVPIAGAEKGTGAYGTRTNNTAAVTKGGPPRAPGAQTVYAPVPKSAPREGVILVSRLSHKEPDKLVEVLETSGKSLAYLKLGSLINVRQTRVSPDGKKLAFIRFVPLNGEAGRGKYYYPEDLYVVDLPLKEPPTEPTRKGLVDPSIAWDADGTGLFISSVRAGVDVSQEAIKGIVVPRNTVRLDVATKKEKVIDLPNGQAVADVSPDGKTLLTRIKVWNGGFDPIGYSSFLVPLGTLKAQRIGDEDDGFEQARFSPDGTRVAGTHVAHTKSKELGLFVADVATRKVTAVSLPKEVTADQLDSLAWAPDGKRLALLWREAVAGAGPIGGAPGGRATAFRVTVLRATGEGAKTVHEYPVNQWYYQIEWANPKLDN